MRKLKRLTFMTIGFFVIAIGCMIYLTIEECNDVLFFVTVTIVIGAVIATMCCAYKGLRVAEELEK